MHELSLAESMVREITSYIEKEKIKKVISVTVIMGNLSRVQKEPFEFAFPIVIEGTILEGCKLNIEQQPGIVNCSDCGEDTQLDIPLVKCSNCGSRNVKFTHGKEFLIKSIEVE
jgi:hydrogenase nickel incorporation protein HypA/HybF